MKEIYQTKVLVRYKKKYLLLKKARDVHPDHVGGWETPGGKLNAGEDAIAASLREIKEETGLDCKIIQELRPLTLEKNNIRTVTSVYLAISFSDKVILSDEHTEYKWISAYEIDDLRNIIYKELFKGYVLEAEKIKRKVTKLSF